MAGDEQKLSSWRLNPLEPGMVELTDSYWRPRGVIAVFDVSDDTVAVVMAVSDEDGFRIVESTFKAKDGTRAVSHEDAARFDFAAAAAELEEATRIRWFSAMDTEWLVLGTGPAVPLGDIRRLLAGVEGPTRTGPQRKATLEQVEKLHRAATRKGQPAARHVAETLDVSISTAHRYIADARRAGLIKENR